jgi:hypothetical protein
MFLLHLASLSFRGEAGPPLLDVNESSVCVCVCVCVSDEGDQSDFIYSRKFF